MGTEALSRVNVLIMILIAIGVAVAAYGELNFVIIGVVEQLSALVFEATRLMLVQARTRRQPPAWRRSRSAPPSSPRHGRVCRCRIHLGSDFGGRTAAHRACGGKKCVTRSLRGLNPETRDVANGFGPNAP